MAASGDGTGWDEASPSDGAKVSTGPVEIRDLRIGTRLRLLKEHTEPASSEAGGEHIMGSAMVYDQDAAPTLRPDATTALTNADKGRLWFDGQRLHVYDGVTNGWFWATGYTRKAILQQAHPSGTNGGTITASTWTKRVLNTEQSDPDGIVELNTTTGVITLNAGTYRINGWAVGYRCQGHQIRLRKTSGTAATVLLGSTVAADQDETIGNCSMIEGLVTVAADDTTYELQHWSQATQATNGMGAAISTGESELFSLLVIEKLGR